MATRRVECSNQFVHTQRFLYITNLTLVMVRSILFTSSLFRIPKVVSVRNMACSYIHIGTMHLFCRQKSLRENYLFACQCVKCEAQVQDPDETSEEEMSDEDEYDEDDD